MISLGVCYVVGAGECREINFKVEKDDLVIAADGGLKYLDEFGIKADIIVGDFDSFGKIPQGENVCRLKPEKDITDMDAAVNIGIEKGYKDFKLFGALGGRIDHSIANLQLISALANQNIKAEIIDEKTNIIAIHNGTVEFDSSKSGYISVFSHSDVCEGVSIEGLKYELKNAELKNSFPLGVSNEFIGLPSKITVKNGTLIIVLAHG